MPPLMMGKMAGNTKSDNLWRRGDRLLLLSRQAREKGHVELAEDILDRAVQLLEEARVIERLAETTTAAHPAS
jgi:hypothetical protein